MYFKTLFLLYVGQLSIQCSYGQRSRHFFRDDYTYLEATESFYKIHKIVRSWFDAKKTCANEGAMLFFSENQIETDAVLVSFNETLYPLAQMHIGISDIVSEGVYETIDGRSINDVYQKWNQGEPNNNFGHGENCLEMIISGQDRSNMNDIGCESLRYFMCKKTLKSLQWNHYCNVPFEGYEYSVKLEKCYKFHTNPVSWTDAYAVCVAEQSYLAVINSQKEADYLFQLTERKHKNKLGDYVRGTVFLGFHNRLDDGWKTVKGVSIEDSGYASWAPQQPNSNGSDKCGSMYYNGLLNDIACDKKSFFICEHEIVPPAPHPDGTVV